MRICSWKRFITFISILLFLIISVLFITSQNKLQVKEVQEYEVKSGETLWEIGTKYRPETMSIQEYIFNLQNQNNIGSIIYPNQILQILIYEEV